jgi:hypothetical protein
MAWAHVGAQTSGTTAINDATTIADSYPSNVTAGSLLVAAVAWYAAGGETISGVSGATNGAFTQIGTTITVGSVGGNWRLAAFYKANATAGAETVTATFSASVDTMRHLVTGEYSGIATSSPLDAAVRTDSAQTDVSSSTDAVTSNTTASPTTQANDLVWGVTLVVRQDNVTDVNAGTGFTERYAGIDGSSWAYLVVEDKNLAAAGTTAATFTQVGGAIADAATLVATFLEPAIVAAVPAPHNTELVRPFNMTVSRGRM